MKEFELTIKAHHGAMAFIELNDDSVWEVGIIPTLSTVPEDHINVGVWKNNGVITYSTTDGNAPNAQGTNVGSNTYTPGVSETENSFGNVYGNGTMNPVLSYAVTNGVNGYIETAQMK